mgnify:FL=1
MSSFRLRKASGGSSLRGGDGFRGLDAVVPVPVVEGFGVWATSQRPFGRWQQNAVHAQSTPKSALVQGVGVSLPVTEALVGSVSHAPAPQVLGWGMALQVPPTVVYKVPSVVVLSLPEVCAPVSSVRGLGSGYDEGEDILVLMEAL